MKHLFVNVKDTLKNDVNLICSNSFAKFSLREGAYISLGFSFSVKFYLIYLTSVDKCLAEPTWLLQDMPKRNILILNNVVMAVSLAL